MTLDFNETAIVNHTLDINNKDEYLKKLVSLKENTKEQELIDSLESLFNKVSILNNEDFKKLYSDRNSNKIFSFPAYYL